MNQLNDPYGLACYPSLGAIYVVDSLKNRAIRFVSNNSTSALVFGGNGNGLNNTQLSHPLAVYFDSFSNNLLIASTTAHEIVRWVIGTNNWKRVQDSTDGSNGTTSIQRLLVKQ